jgi:4-hydroxy-4-methyl-2-oxoglutarate aldolase
MTDFAAFRLLSPTTLADILGRKRVMDLRIRPLWAAMPRIAGPAYTVQCVPGDNLMLHAAIYRAPAGSIIVVESGDLNFALAGGNVCAVAQKHDIAGFVLDGVMRDIQEIRSSGFPVFACGVMPIPGTKDALGSLNQPVVCGGVVVAPGDIVVADEEGIVVTPRAESDSVLKQARERTDRASSQSLADWESKHRRRVAEILQRKGFKE